MSEFAFDRYLQGGEPVKAIGVAPDGPISFTLPALPLIARGSDAGATQRPAVNLETLLLEPDQNRACLTWRAAVPCDRQALKVERIIVDMARRSDR